MSMLDIDIAQKELAQVNILTLTAPPIILLSSLENDTLLIPSMTVKS